MRVLGINDDVLTCECCGKTNLKCTVVLGTDSGEVYFGRACAARAMKTTVTRIDRAAEDVARKAEKEARETVYEIGSARSVVDWKVVSVSSQGDCSFLCLANGSKKEVFAWAESKWSGKHVDVQGMFGMTSGKRVKPM